MGLELEFHPGNDWQQPAVTVTYSVIVIDYVTVINFHNSYNGYGLALNNEVAR